MDEIALIHKLVTTWHLNVAERRALPNQQAKVSLASRAIADVLHEAGWFPADWRPDRQYDGGVIEARNDGNYFIHWKAEASYLNFQPVGIDRFDNDIDAARAWLHGMFPTNIDDIPLNWSA